MGTARNWFNTVRKKFVKSSHQQDIVILHCENLSQQPMMKEARHFPNISAPSQTTHLTREDIAAIKIQSIFRGHLARRAYRASRSLVKLQAVARGAYVRKQTQIAMACLHLSGYRLGFVPANSSASTVTDRQYAQSASPSFSINHEYHLQQV